MWYAWYRVLLRNHRRSDFILSIKDTRMCHWIQFHYLFRDRTNISMAKFSICVSIAIALMATLLIVQAESTNEPTGRIIGGERARPGQFPHQVSVRRTRDRTHFCGGVLISDLFVLTAANCTQGIYTNIANVYVIIGSTSMSANYGTSYGVTRIRNHPQFDPTTLANDISVIRLNGRVAFNHLIRAIRLPLSNVAAGSGAIISGWGLHDVRKQFCFIGWISYWFFIINFQVSVPTFLGELLFQHTTILDLPSCRHRLGNRVSDTMVCTNNRHDRGICTGDIGGPLITRDGTTLVGIASWYTECGDERPNVFTSVFSHLQFIRSEINS